MAKKSRYIEYVNGMQHISSRKKQISTKESVLTKLKRLRDKEFTMTIPIVGGEADAH